MHRLGWRKKRMPALQKAVFGHGPINLRVGGVRLRCNSQ